MSPFPARIYLSGVFSGKSAAGYNVLHIGHTLIPCRVKTIGYAKLEIYQKIKTQCKQQGTPFYIEIENRTRGG